MIPKNGHRFSDKIMLSEDVSAGRQFKAKSPRSNRLSAGLPAGPARSHTDLGSAPRKAGMSRRLVFAIVLAAVAGAAPPAATQAPFRAAAAPIGIEVEAVPIEAFDARAPERRRVGALEFIGGMELKSRYREFGGFSGLRMLPDGERFVALSDRGFWFTGRIVYAHGRPAGIAQAQMAPMLGPDGRTLNARGWYDTESLAADEAGTLYVGIERVHRIVRFDFDRSGVFARGEPIAVPAEFSRLPANKGIEALAFVPDGQALAGTLIAISERGLDRAGNIRAFLIGGPTPGEFTVKRRDGFDVSDCALLPSGDLVLLERRFSWISGMAMRLRRIAMGAIRPGALVDGPTLMSADMGSQIDNMEGLGIHRGLAGDTVLTVISDDNFSFLQRTLLLQFRMVGE